MKELESSRMNFLRQRRSAFTYKTMIAVLVVWVLLLTAVYGLQILRAVDARREVAAAKEQLDRLNAEKDAQLKALEALGRERMSSAVKEDLTAILTSRPHWSRVLRELTKALPAQVWLQSVKVMQERGMDSRLDVVGKARSQRSLTNFIMTLESSGLFRNTELASTKQLEKSEGAFEYDITTIPVLSKF